MKTIRVLAIAAAISIAAPPAHAQLLPEATDVEQTIVAARAAALNDLSEQHRADVQLTIAQAINGSLRADAAARRIDSILTSAEARAVLDEQERLRRSPNAARMSKVAGNFPNADPGRFLLSVFGVTLR